MLPRLNLPPPPAGLAVMGLAFLLPGLVFHDLWKTQDAIALGIVHGMAVSGDLVVPRVAGVAWLWDQPLYHWVALVFGKLFGWAIELHAAARIASGAFVALAFMLIYRAEREWLAPEDPDTRRTAAGAAFLILLGCIGLLVHAHEGLPELAALAAMCAALTALPYAAARPLAAGAAFGVALGVAALSASWIVPLGMALAVVAAHFVAPEWRTRSGVAFLAVSLTIALVLAIAWPLMLALRSGACSWSGGRSCRSARAPSAGTCATSSPRRAGSPGRPGRSRCGARGRCAAAGASCGFSCRPGPCSR